MKGTNIGWKEAKKWNLPIGWLLEAQELKTKDLFEHNRKAFNEQYIAYRLEINKLFGLGSIIRDPRFQDYDKIVKSERAKANGRELVRILVDEASKPPSAYEESRKGRGSPHTTLEARRLWLQEFIPRAHVRRLLVVPKNWKPDPEDLKAFKKREDYIVALKKIESGAFENDEKRRNAIEGFQIRYALARVENLKFIFKYDREFDRVIEKLIEVRIIERKMPKDRKLSGFTFYRVIPRSQEQGSTEFRNRPLTEHELKENVRVTLAKEALYWAGLDDSNHYQILKMDKSILKRLQDHIKHRLAEIFEVSESEID